MYCCQCMKYVGLGQAEFIMYCAAAAHTLAERTKSAVGTVFFGPDDATYNVWGTDPSQVTNQCC